MKNINILLQKENQKKKFFVNTNVEELDTKTTEALKEAIRIPKFF